MYMAVSIVMNKNRHDYLKRKQSFFKTYADARHWLKDKDNNDYYCFISRSDAKIVYICGLVKYDPFYNKEA